METLTIRPTSLQIASLLLATLGLALAATAAMRSHLAGGDPNGRVLGLGVGAEAGALIAGMCAIWYCRAFTECTPAGIRSRGLGTEWRCDWRDVREIAVRPGRRGQTYTVILTTASGLRVALGAPVAGGVMPDPEFEGKVAEIRDYWHRVTGADAWRGSRSPAAMGSVVPPVPSRRSPALISRAAVMLILFAAAAAIPVALAEGGPALGVRLGWGEPGYYTAYASECASTCYWVGRFSPGNGSAARDGMTMAPGADIAHIGDRIPAVYPGSAAMIYPAGGGTSWLPLAILLLIVTIGLALEVLWIAGRRSRWRRTGGGQVPGLEPRPGGPRSVPGGKRGSALRLPMTAGTALLIVGASGFAVTLHSVPPLAPSRTVKACAYYTEWLLAQSGKDPAKEDLTALAQAEREAPGGQLSQDLAVLSSDMNAAATADGTTTEEIALVSTITDMNAVTKDCA